MKPINLNNIEEKNVGGGDFPQLKPGAYACKVTAVIDNAGREYLDVLLDICVGEFEGYFSDKFYADKPWSHHVILSYKDANLGYLKRNLRMFTESNTGFDAEAAIMGGQDQMLVGKVVGCTFREEEYYDKKSGEFKLGNPRPDRLISTAEVEGTEAPKPRMLKDDEKRKAMERAGESGRTIDAYEDNGWRKPTAAAPVADVYTGDVPFM